MSNSAPTDLPYRRNVGIMILNKAGRVWVGHRLVIERDELPPGSTRLWQMPQGGIDKGEKPLDAAKRELWEETGITTATFLAKTSGWLTYDLPAEVMGTALKGKYRGQKQKWFAFRFEGDESEINIASPPDGAPVEFDRWKWVDMEELPALVVAFKQDIYRQVVTEFRHLAE